MHIFINLYNIYDMHMHACILYIYIITFTKVYLPGR